MTTRKCSFDGCGKASHARGLCSGHWNQWYVGKALRPLGKKSETAGLSIEDRFWFYVDERDFNGCWNWTGNRTKPGARGYGKFGVGQREIVAHRFAFELLVGPVPEGFEIDHICRNRHCVNPSHLRLVTRKQNMEHQGVQEKNTSGFRGVHWDKRRQSWYGKVQHNKRQYFVGYFSSAEDADSAVVSLRNELFTHNDLDKQAQVAS